MTSDELKEYGREARKPWKQAGIGTVVLLLTINFMSIGYGFGHGEQTVLSIKGISWADKNAFVADWFNNSAPQPHILFDVITFLGDRMQFLAGMYLVYFIASCAVFAYGTALLAERWIPEHLRYLQHFVNVLSVVGPTFLLGTFLTIHFQSVPNMAGGCLAYCTVAHLLTGRTRAALILIPVTAAFHLQHGILISSIALLFVLTGATSSRLRLCLSALSGIIISVAIGVHRDLFSGAAEVAGEISEIGSTGHFNVETWPTEMLTFGLPILAIALLNFLIPDRERFNSRVFFSFFAIVAIPVGGIVSDLKNLEVLENAARSFFVYRYSMILVPFACWFVVRSFVAAATARFGLAVAWLLAFVVGYTRLLSAPFTMLPEAGRWQVWMLLSLILILIRSGISLPKFRVPLGQLSLVVLLLLGFLVGVDKFKSPWPKIDFSASDFGVAIGQSMALSIKPEEVVASDPSMQWLRLTSRRSIVVDCKGAPYGGDPWAEYLRRLRLLGVDRPNVCTGYKTLELNRLLGLRESTGASLLLLLPDDRAYAEASQKLRIRWTSGGDNPWILFELPEEAD